MKKKIDTLTLSHFKAFQEGVTIPLGGKHLLVYGANGSGKSSLFWGLHMLFQSAFKKNPADIEKYFQTQCCAMLSRSRMVTVSNQLMNFCFRFAFLKR